MGGSRVHKAHCETGREETIDPKLAQLEMCSFMKFVNSNEACFSINVFKTYVGMDKG
jgi:hypothetical protein